MLKYITAIFQNYKAHKQLANCTYEYLLNNISEQKIYTYQQLKELIDLTLLLDCKHMTIKLNYKLLYAHLKSIIFKNKILHIMHLNVNKKIIISKIGEPS